MEFKVDKEFIIEAHKAACPDWKCKIESKFPNAFKTELKMGEWYKQGPFKFNFQGGKAANNYGWDISGNWCNNLGNADNDEAMPMSEEEVSAALIAEAKKMGFKVGVTILRGEWYTGFSPSKTTINKENYPSSGFEFNNNSLSLEGFTLFSNGKWAEILPEEKKVITKDKALKILAKKYGTTVDKIEIQ